MYINQNPRSKAYFEDCVSLAQSIVIKMTSVAERMNEMVLKEYDSDGYTIDTSDPSTWRYYKHIYGNYHESDEVMTVKSLDTLETIDFTKENLEVHSATLAAYTFNSDYYSELADKYPNQELLIRGIINPYTGSNPWDLDDGTILAYDSTLVESNEYDLIVDLQDWIDQYFARWYISNFSIIEDYYSSAFLSGFYTKLLMQIMIYRFGSIKKPSVHSYFVNEYLRGYYYLDEYSDYLTTDQKLYLYRNISRISKEIGRQDTFDELVENILIPRSIPLNTYYIRANNAVLESSGGESTYEGVEVSLTSTADSNTVNVSTISELVIKLEEDYPSNEAIRTEEIERAEQEVRRNVVNNLPTKILHSEVTDVSKYTNYSVVDVAMNEWLRMVGENRYTSYYIGVNPQTGESMELTAKDAYILYYYLYGHINDMAPTEIPTFNCFSVRKSPVPKRAEFLSRIETKRVTDEISALMGTGWSVIGTYANVTEFTEYCESVFNKDQEVRDFIANIQNHITRGMVEASLTLAYDRKEFVLEEGNYYDWAVTKGVVIDEMLDENVTVLMADILNQMIGTLIDTSSSLEGLQTALLSLMKKLTSYNTRFVTTVNLSGMVLSDWPVERGGDVSINTTSGAYAEEMLIDYLTENSMEETVSCDVKLTTSVGEPRVVTETWADVSVSVVENAGQVGHYISNIDDMGLSATTSITSS